ncbi:MAG: undecaprenyl-diphosphatase [Thiomonas sp. 15-66-11]|jgi:undecaprenyl-diphosphatase|uniref:Undecaprenyl-diphosphatase n=1 Tax=Thiomonas delicata TaxID=364030 RepID=A0A238D533_THIDL|nr:undecaprenyl-diphosphate phosphatase [Thiomonas delicata]OZB43077.1 MAG: undecaprenyl-diphosphatase [Thiomonas sp. 15-66-11]SBP88345.1 Undecaprenyl-diphosphatase [Thiomonas delicata]
MDTHTAFIAAILGLVEGLTEFLPISSTGHLILAGSLLGWVNDKAKVFEIAIQSGAILAVIWHYRRRLNAVVKGLAAPQQQARRAAWRFALNLLIAFLPAAMLGLVFASRIKQYLFAPIPVAAAFIVGGLVILWAERRPSGGAGGIRIESVDAMRPLDALKVGLAQSFALIPGTSRSGATIIGGMLFGLSRIAATEFSFFLAIPTLLAATCYDLLKHRALFSAADLPAFALGMGVSFASALVVVRWLLRYVGGHSFVPFAWYRLAFGALVLVTARMGWVQWAS